MFNINYHVSIKLDSGLSIFVLENKTIKYGIITRSVTYLELKYWKLAVLHVKKLLLLWRYFYQKTLKSLSKMFKLRTTGLISCWVNSLKFLMLRFVISEDGEVDVQ